MEQSDEINEMKKYEKYLNQKLKEKDKNTEKQHKQFEEGKQEEKRKYEDIIAGLTSQIDDLQAELKTRRKTKI